MNRNKIKKMLEKLFFPPIFLMILLILLSTCALIYIFVKGFQEHLVSYAVYTIAFYTLSVVCVKLSFVLPECIKSLKQKIYDNSIGEKYMTDVTFRTRVSLYVTLVVNLLYAGATQKGVIK